jgi:1-acyl-sn-glycerol-3-phosphate acyltransferase
LGTFKEEMESKNYWIKSGLALCVTIVLAPFYFLVLLAGYRWRQRIGPELVRFYSRICLFIFRVRITQQTHPDAPQARQKGMLIISNHSSFLDIFVLSAIFGSVFVSKAEIKYYPIVGQIAWLMGVVFLDRDSPKEKFRLLKTIAYECGEQRLVVFPQGTTSRITDRVPFNRGVFKVIELNPALSLLPVTLRYEDDEDIAWHPPQSLSEHTRRICARDSIHVEVIVHNPVTIDHYQGRSPAQICSLIEQTVLSPLRRQ